ncbi:MAG: MBL fold metallo-hydrolase [Prevotella sp.]|nr:MBL fold metallo-hydrolase [Prevotella sp.]
MKLTILGSGTSGGVPGVGCSCEVCQSKDKYDKRLRSSALLEEGETRLLIDCGPDFRQQIMGFDFKPIDAVLLTHYHFDHVAGIDDIRPFCVFGPVNFYADKKTVKALHDTIPYCFAENPYPGVPLLNLQEITPHVPLQVGNITIIPFVVMHGKLPIMAFRIGKLAYITDMKTIEPEEMEYLNGVETLVVNALKKNKPHHSHQSLEDAIAFAKNVGAKHTYVIHMSHGIGRHKETSEELPEGVELAYDGLVVEV